MSCEILWGGKHKGYYFSLTTYISFSSWFVTTMKQRKITVKRKVQYKVLGGLFLTLPTNYPETSA